MKTASSLSGRIQPPQQRTTTERAWMNQICEIPRVDDPCLPSGRPLACFGPYQYTRLSDSEASSGRSPQDFRKGDVVFSQPVAAGSSHNTLNVPARRPATGPAGHCRRRQFDHCMPSGNWRALDCIRNRIVVGTSQRCSEGNSYYIATVPSKPSDHTAPSRYRILTVLQVVNIRCCQSGGIHHSTPALTRCAEAPMIKSVRLGDGVRLACPW